MKVKNVPLGDFSVKRCNLNHDTLGKNAFNIMLIDVAYIVHEVKRSIEFSLNYQQHKSVCQLLLLFYFLKIYYSYSQVTKLNCDDYYFI